MTTGARSFAYRVIAMRLNKRSFGTVMAAKAERCFCFYQEVFLVRTVGEVAGGATLLPYSMDHLLFVILFLVALKASFVPFRIQEMACLRRMGIMAGNAFTPLQSRVDIRLIQADLLFGMAWVTNLISLFFQDKLAD